MTEPYRDWLMIDQAPAQTHSKGGLALPGAYQCAMAHGTVLAVGPGYQTEHGAYITVYDIKPGDVVYWAAAGGTLMKLKDGREVYVLPARNVVLIERSATPDQA